jgi:hypothetical protein
MVLTKNTEFWYTKLFLFILIYYLVIFFKFEGVRNAELVRISIAAMSQSFYFMPISQCVIQKILELINTVSA